MIDCWIDWMVNPTWFPFQFNRILSILVSLLLLSISPPSFLCSDLFLFNKAKSISYFNINDCIALSIYWSMDSQMGIITYKYQSIRTSPLCHYQIQSSWLLKQPVCYQYWTNPSSNHHLIMIGRLASLSFVNVQYVIDGSLVITMIMIEMNDWSIETTILIQYQCNNGKEKQHNQADKIDILIIIESCIGIKNRFETNKQSFHQNVPNQWLINELFSIIDLCLILTRSARMEGTSMNEIKSINQYSKLISIELPGMDPSNQ